MELQITKVLLKQMAVANCQMLRFSLESVPTVCEQMNEYVN